MKIFNFNIAVREYIPPFIYNIIKNKPADETFISKKFLSFSQYHEDIFVDVILKCKNNGFYVDIGANHPTDLSNTKRFYDRGWRGINIEPNPSLFTAFQRDRAGDINLNVGVGDATEILPFYVMSASTLSSFDKDAALEGGKLHGAILEKVIEVEVCPLQQIFEKYDCKDIDLLSVDTEGYDLRVIQSNDWVKWRPRVIIIETNQDDGAVNSFLIDKGYELVFDNLTNAIYVENDYLASIAN